MTEFQLQRIRKLKEEIKYLKSCLNKINKLSYTHSKVINRRINKQKIKGEEE